jgi:hypothetical protein
VEVQILSRAPPYLAECARLGRSYHQAALGISTPALQEVVFEHARSIINGLHGWSRNLLSTSSRPFSLLNGSQTVEFLLQQFPVVDALAQAAQMSGELEGKIIRQSINPPGASLGSFHKSVPPQKGQVF